jgi:hypothetical protein
MDRSVILGNDVDNGGSPPIEGEPAVSLVLVVVLEKIPCGLVGLHY